MRRRDFIKAIAASAAEWPLAANAQKSGRVRRIGMLVSFGDSELKAFREELEKRGWSEGRNIHIDYRVAPAADGVQAFAKELVAMQPEVIFAQYRSYSHTS
jgi:putative tryptophan/tyrosine transport system substrate-binding protein